MKFTIIPAALLFKVVVALTSRAYADGGVPLWTNHYSGPMNDLDYATAMAVDTSGNVFVSGFSPGNGSDFDYVTIKYSNAGVPLWTNRYNGSGNFDDQASAMAVDRTGNVFVSGRSWGTNSQYDFATVAYSSEGVPLWTNRFGPAINSYLSAAVAVDSSGNVFVTGGSGYVSSSGYATIKYSSSGVPLWTNRYKGLGDNKASAIAVDSSNHVFVTGYSIGDYATVAYANAGVPLWTNRYNGPANLDDTARAIAVDATGNVIVTGQSWGSYATIAYSNAGVPLWTNRYTGPVFGDHAAVAVAVDASGNVFVTGYAKSTNPYPDTYDWATVAYSGAGVPLWTNRYNGPGNREDKPNAIAVDSSGNVFVTGYSTGGDGNFDYATVAYSNAGMPLWTNRYEGPGDDTASAIAVDSIGNVFVTGCATGSDGDYDYVTIKYSSSMPLVHLDFQMMNNQLILSWTNAVFGLQTATAIIGTFTNIPAATSPYTNPITGPKQYFRLKAN